MFCMSGLYVLHARIICFAYMFLHVRIICFLLNFRISLISKNRVPSAGSPQNDGSRDMWRSPVVFETRNIYPPTNLQHNELKNSKIELYLFSYLLEKFLILKGTKMFQLLLLVIRRTKQHGLIFVIKKYKFLH